jgi:gliding motility-associated-like protein
VLTESNHFKGTLSDVMIVNKAAVPDSGVYWCRVSNPAAPLLVLTERKIVVTINDNRLSQNFIFSPFIPRVCGGKPIVSGISLSSALPVQYEIISGSALIAGDTIKPLQPGNLSIRFGNDGNDFYKPIGKRDTVLIVSAPVVSDSFSIIKNLPKISGASLTLQVNDPDTSDFLWITPVGDSVSGAKIIIPEVAQKDEGNYLVKAGKNSCFYHSEIIPIVFSLETGILVYQLVTPNQDGKNDVFYIEGIENYPDSEVTVFNLWSQQVFRKKNYLNDWEGASLPGGTYYYNVHIPSIHISLKGELYLKK